MLTELNPYKGFLSSAWFSPANAGSLRNRLRQMILEEFRDQVHSVSHDLRRCSHAATIELLQPPTCQHEQRPSSCELS